MTTEKALAILDDLRAWNNTPPPDEEAVEALSLAISTLRAQQEAEKNEPLTLEQLLEMDGQPVWVEHPDGYKHYNGWTLVFVSWKVQKQVRVTYATGGSGDVSLLLDDGAKIYRRPPEKEVP